MGGWVLLATTAVVFSPAQGRLSIVDDVQPAPATTVAVPVWDPADQKRYPAFRAVTEKRSSIPVRIVVETYDGATRVLPYSEATVAMIDATWANDEPADDLFTTGASSR